MTRLVPGTHVRRVSQRRPAARRPARRTPPCNTRPGRYTDSSGTLGRTRPPAGTEDVGTGADAVTGRTHQR